MAQDPILICLTTFHGPLSWLERAVQSVKNQTHKNFECWVVKDGCDRGVRFQDRYERNSVKECNNCQKRTELLQKISTGDERFMCWIMPCYFGAFGWGSRNFVLINTAHRLISYLDDIDWWEPTHLEVCYDCMQDTKKEFVFSGSKVFDESGALIEERLQQNRVPAEFKRKIYNRQSHEIISTSELMHRRRAFINYGGWRFTRECEWDILNRWLKNKATYLYTNKYTVNLTTKNNKGVPYKF